MEFNIEKHSSTPAIKQIEEQIKFAVMMGIFRNGDTLPSIRDIEKQTGVHHSQIHKAYLALRRSGLLVLTRGKGSVISTATDSPRLINEKCFKLSQKIISRTRQMGISPTAFARYLSRQAQESERKLPLISYVDDTEEIAGQTAAEISNLWQVHVKGITYQDLKSAASKGGPAQRFLVNHIMCEHVRSMLPKKKSSIIPVEVRASELTIRLLSEIKPDSSVLLIHLPQPSHRLRYMIAQLQQLVKAPGVRISSTLFRGVSAFNNLLKDSRYDYYLVGPGVRGSIPRELRNNPRILLIAPQLDPTSLEAARIRAGVVI
ncbi:MAG: GntR family transcriptional regulator [Acidobacteria bacterium]|nr:GntR family transcriptional regulator [Acidobacteriota bacterium]